MSFYDKVRGGKPINPAIALYKHWHRILAESPALEVGADGRLLSASNYGSSYYGIQFHYPYGDSNPYIGPRPPISFGGFVLNRDGTFKMSSFHGWRSRDNFAKNTFLRWGHVHGQYVWFVDTSAEAGDYSWGYNSSRAPRNLGNYNDQVHYYAERIVGGAGYRRPAPWLKLVWSGTEWVMAFAYEGSWVGGGHSEPIRVGHFEHYDRLRAKRYQRYERDHMLAIGALVREERKIISAEEIERRQQAKVNAIIAGMSVGMAARTVPLRKTTEEVGLWQQPSGCP